MQGYLRIGHAIAYRAIRDELGDLERLAAWAAGKLGGGARLARLTRPMVKNAAVASGADANRLNIGVNQVEELKARVLFHVIG